MTLRRALAFVLVLAALGAPCAARQVGAQGSPPFDELARRADAARAAGRLEEAAGLYRRALAARPGWTDGLWALGTIAYERSDFAECRDALSRLVALRPKAAPAWALRGLCEFETGPLAASREHLERGLALGLPPSEDLGRAALYHQALALVREGQFDAAIAPLRTILKFQAATPELETACGLVLLRRPLLPAAVPAGETASVAAAGDAYCAHLARHPEEAVKLFRALIAAHPKERYLRYGCGLALAQQGSAEALELYRQEVALFPDDVLARVELAFGLLAQGKQQEALEPAREAARLAPGLFVTRFVLGRALVATGALAEGIAELEAAAAREPRVAAIQLALARAYQQAGRPADAARARAAFQALEPPPAAAGAAKAP
ncbi:MAG: tetratricopeptide repeat protein [Vicinamibacteria bacterium]